MLVLLERLEEDVKSNITRLATYVGYSNIKIEEFVYDNYIVLDIRSDIFKYLIDIIVKSKQFDSYDYDADMEYNSTTITIFDGDNTIDPQLNLSDLYIPLEKHEDIPVNVYTLANNIAWKISLFFKHMSMMDMLTVVTLIRNLK